MEQKDTPRSTESKPDSMVAVAASAEFVLFDRPSAARNGWRSLKLVRVNARPHEKRQKLNWWLGWNGERLSRSSDAESLKEEHPALYDWVIGALQEHDKAVSTAR